MSWGDYDEKNKPVVKTDEDGNLVLHDPTALGMVEAVSRHNCKLVYEAQLDRVEHFKRRMVERGETPDKIVIVLINVDDFPNGRYVAELLMPGFNWQEIRDRGEVPFARGLADRAGIQDVLSSLDLPGAIKLSEMPKDRPLCVVIDHGFSEVIEV